ncbi:MAG: hypothetical protein GC206_07810 [Alphaproteobacteria bacterium]|nr:hypothetical protein [Alphaproteobacteria bacterium]
MRVDDYRRLEAEAATRAVSCLPVIAGDSRSRGWPAEGVCALIVTGSDHRPSQQERAQIDAAVRHAVRARIPTLAMSDGGDLALAAAGFELPTEQENAVLIHRGVEVLETDACVQDALERVLEG